MSTENYYKPYCNQCKQYVHPQVVSSTYISGGRSCVTHKKMCPECGDQVFSQSDVVAYKAEQEAQKKGMRLVLIVLLVCFVPVIIGFIVLIVFVLAMMIPR